MTRDSLAQFIVGQYATLLAAMNIPSVEDGPTGYGPALDSVMRQLGLPVQSADDGDNPTIPDDRAGDAIALTQYYALDWLLLLSAASVTSTNAGVKKYNNQRFTQVLGLLKIAKARVPAQYVLDAGDFSMVRLQLDILEPWYAS